MERPEPEPAKDKGRGGVQTHSGNFPAPDVAAMTAMQNYHAGELPRIQARADKWIAGLTAITGVLTTAVIIEGATSFDDLADTRELFGFSLPTKWVLIALMLAGAVLLVVAIVSSYSAANGSPVNRTDLEDLAKGQWTVSETSPSPAVAWINSVNSSVDTSRRQLRRALVTTLAGLACLAGGLVFAWTTPSAAGAAVCLQTSSGSVELSDLPTIKSGQVTLKACDD